MSIEEMRAAAGLPAGWSDAEVAQGYAEWLEQGAGAPLVEPVSLDLAKMQLRIDGTREDMLVAQAISAARGWVEDQTGHWLVRRQGVEVMGHHATTVNLHAWPLVSVDAVEFVSATGLQALDEADFDVALLQRPAQLSFIGSPFGRFGAAREGVGAATVRVTLTAGYAEGRVPAQLVSAMLILIGAFYAHRGEAGLPADVERAARSLCNAFKRHVL